MIREVLIAAAVLAGPGVAAAQQASPTSPTVSQLTVRAPDKNAPPAATIEVPSDDTALGQWASVWPADALKERLHGHVVLSCDIDRYGLAEWCKVASETPANKGFGAAALELRPTFKVKPAMGADGPIEAIVNVAIDFKPPDMGNVDWGAARYGGPTSGPMAAATQDVSGYGGPTLRRRAVSMLNNPVWASTVSYDDVSRAYPARAGDVEGYAVAHCEVARSGALSGCQIIKEDPDNRGFGKAALGLASKFRVAPQWTSAPHGDDIWVDIPIRFPPPGSNEPRSVTSPYWVAGFDPGQALKLFPAEAAAKGLTSGYGVAKCNVTKTGTLSDCAPEDADPEGLGFSEAAAELASTMRMNPWTTDGQPVDGAVVRIGVRLSLKADQ